MRKILASMLATAMVASMAATMTFAAAPTAATTAAYTVTASSFQSKSFDEVTLEIDLDGAATAFDPELFTESVSLDFGAAATGAEIAHKIDGTKIRNVELMGKYYTVTLKQVGSTATLTAAFSPAVATGADIAKVEVKIGFHETGTAAGVLVDVNGAQKFTNVGTGAPNADVEIPDALNIEDIIVCDGNNNPIPLSEKDYGVGKDRNNEQGIQGSRTVYFMVRDGGFEYDDNTFWKLKITKGDNAKLIKAVSDVTKNFGSELYNVVEGGTVGGTSGRHRFIKVELKDIFTDDEYKLSLDLRLSPKTKALDVFAADTRLTDDTEIKVKDFTFYVKNIVKPADGDWKVGINGLMLNPLENDWNEVTYFDEDGDLAFMKFFGDSDVSKFYAKLSTKWEHADYASYFNDQDAFIFDFTGSPKISATSRCDLQIYNPFVDDDGNETIDPETATIYQVIDGDLFDVTDNFSYEEGDNGDMAFVTRTRFLGTYIICEKAVEEAADTEAPDLVPEETPVDVTPSTGSQGGGKGPANTGKWA